MLREEWNGVGAGRGKSDRSSERRAENFKLIYFKKEKDRSEASKKTA
jgi:hypothetical protein